MHFYCNSLFIFFPIFITFCWPLLPINLKGAKIKYQPAIYWCQLNYSSFNISSHSSKLFKEKKEQSYKKTHSILRLNVLVINCPKYPITNCIVLTLDRTINAIVPHELIAKSLHCLTSTIIINKVGSLIMLTLTKLARL